MGMRKQEREFKHRRVLVLAKEGLSIKAIQERTGLSASSIRKILKDNHIKTGDVREGLPSRKEIKSCSAPLSICHRNFGNWHA